VKGAKALQFEKGEISADDGTPLEAFRIVKRTKE
jgi:hypothetical protein